MEQRAESRGWRAVAAPSAVALAAIVAHLPALGAGYILDDDTLLVSNPWVRTWPGLWTLLTHEFFLATARPEGSAQYRPVSGALNWLTWHLFGPSPVTQHAFNMAMHAAVAVLLFFAIRAFGAPRRLCALAAALFAVHPVTAMEVAYVEGRQDLLAWVIVLGAVIALTRAQRWPVVAGLTFGATLFATHCREAFAGSFVLMGVASCVQAPRRGRALAAAGVGGLLSLSATLLLRRTVGVSAYASPPWTMAILFEGAVGVELRLLKDVVWPTDLALFVTPVKLGLALAGAIALALAAVVACAGRLVASEARAPPLVWSSASVLATSAALYSLVVIQSEPISDRYAYGAAIAAAFLGSAFVWARIRSPPRLAALVSPLVVVAIMPMTWAREATFRDETTLQDTMVKERPDDPESQIAEGLQKLGKGDIEGAYPHCVAYADKVGRPGRATECLAAWLSRHGRSCEASTLMRPFALARPGYAAVRRMALATAFACPDYPGVETLLAAWEPALSGAPDVVQARAELTRRLGSHPTP